MPEARLLDADWLDATLGLRALVQHILEVGAPGEALDGGPTGDDDPVLDALLGLDGVARSLLDLLDRCADASGPAPAQADPPVEDLLR